MNIIIRIFPKDRISNVTIENIVINSSKPTGSDVFNILTSITPQSYKLARGTRFIKDDNVLVDGETLNAFPIA